MPALREVRGRDEFNASGGRDVGPVGEGEVVAVLWPTFSIRCSMWDVRCSAFRRDEHRTSNIEHRMLNSMLRKDRHSPGDLLDHFLQSLEIDRLGQVRVEAGFFAAAEVFGLAEAAQRDAAGAVAGAELLHDFR